MSALGASISFFIVGVLAFILRIFFFVDISEVDKSKLKRVKENSYILVTVGILFLALSLFLFAFYFPQYSNPLDTLYNDFIEIKIYYAIFIIAIGIGFLIFREKSIKNWEQDGIIFPISKEKYSKFAIFLGTILVVIGFLLIII
jgi:hydrogenase-4 membrane subunit HyfE